jgi:antitoxin component YwqK of YwqJK toxin-antitoxin module
MRYLLFFVLFFSLGAKAQWKSYVMGVKGDTLNRVDQQDRKQGPWVVKVPDLRGERGYEEEGYFKNDKKEGRWVRYSLQGDKIAAENYRWGQKDGRCEYYNNAEDLVRLESWRAIDPQNPYDTIPVTDPKNPYKIIRFEVIKVESPSVKHGTWRYYDPNTGRVEKSEQWVLDRLKKDDEDEEEIDVAAVSDETAINATAKKAPEKKKLAKPKEVLEFEKKNAGKKKIKVRDGNTGGY